MVEEQRKIPPFMDQPAATQQPQSTSPVDHSKKSGFPGIVLALIGLIIGALLAGGYFMMTAPKKEAAQDTTEKVPTTSLPSDAVQVSGCIPHMGEHWVKLSDLPAGPYYLVNQGRVLGLEYMFKTNDVPNEVGSHMSAADKRKFAMENKLTFSDAVKAAIPSHIDLPVTTPINTWDLEWSAPHAGLIEPHYDVHFYFVKQAELENVCPDAAFGSDLPPEMATELQRLGVPLPQ